VSIRTQLIQLLPIIAIIGAIIVIILKHGIAIWLSIKCAKQPRTNKQSLIISHNQSALSKRRTMLNSIGLLDVSQPSRSHGRTELITKVINLFSNCSTFVHPNVVRKTEINAYLSKQLQ
jgi:hypothetical protein